MEHKVNNEALRFPSVIVGLWQIADMERDGSKVDPDVAAKALDEYYVKGFQTFDMADHYGSAEFLCGHFKTNRGRKDARFMTKWVPSPGTFSPEMVRTAVEEASNKLKTNCIDLMQFHAWNYADPRWLDCLWELDKMRQEGLIAALGLTNFDEAHLNMVIQSGIKVVSNQVCHSLLDRRAAGKMAETCLKHGIALLAFGTVAGGFFSEKWLGAQEPQLDERLTWSQSKYKRYIDQAGGWSWFQQLLQVLQHIARAHHTSISNIASAWVLAQPAVTSVIIGARLGSSQHIESHLALQEIKLTQADLKALDEVLVKGRQIPGDCGDEYRKPPFLTASGDLSHHLSEVPPPYPTFNDDQGKIRALSGTSWESMAGYSRAVRKGNRILVSGTTATHGNRVVGGSDPAAQAHFVIDKIEGAIQSLGGRLEDVVRTRIFVSDIKHWEPIARAHGHRFGHIQPVNTMVQASLIGDEYIVEIEAEAILE